MVLTRSIRVQGFKEEVERLAKIEIDFFSHSLSLPTSIVYRPLFLSTMEEQFMHNVSKEQIKTLTKFAGSSDDDIVKWLQDIDEIFDRAQLQPANKFVAVQSYLTGAATKWFRFNKTDIPDWPSFKSSILKAYQPTLPQILDRMEHRHQRSGESVMEYYHDKLGLCSQVDSQMSASMLIHYLTKGLTPSLIPHVIRRHPTTPAEFLRVAQDEEKIRFTLVHLSSINSSEHDYPIDDTPTDPLIAVVPDRLPRSTPNSFRSQASSSPRPLMDLPIPSFSSLPRRHSSRPSLFSSSSRQCYQCHQFGHIASHCPSRKNV